MTQIQLPLLIREKIKDYLSFTEWRDKMTQVCIEYEKTYSCYEYFSYGWIVKHFINLISFPYCVQDEHIMTKSYNYRNLTYNPQPQNVLNKYGAIMSKLSPNY
jgi:hypothetical protein